MPRPHLPIVLSIALLIASCTTKRLPIYSPKTAADPAFTRSAGSLTVVARPLSDGAQIERYFGQDLLLSGIFPVFVSLENGSTSESDLFGDDAFAIGAATAQPGLGNEARSVGGEVALISGAVLFSLPLMAIGGSLITDAQEIERNFEAQRLGTVTLSPGETESGFVYFQLPKGAKPIRDGELLVRWTDLGTHRPASLTVPMPIAGVHE